MLLHMGRDMGDTFYCLLTSHALFSGLLKVGGQEGSGKLLPMMGVASRHSLQWQDIIFEVRGGRRGPAKPILRGCSGNAHPGELVALVGPSGRALPQMGTMWMLPHAHGNREMFVICKHQLGSSSTHASEQFSTVIQRMSIVTQTLRTVHHHLNV
jgi:hypothetical protein